MKSILSLSSPTTSIPLDARQRKYKKPYRSREEIISDMLEAVRDSSFCTSTDMAYHGRLPYMYAREYFRLVFDAGLIVEAPRSSYQQVIYYDITSKGTHFLALWYKLRESLSLS